MTIDSSNFRQSIAKVISVTVIISSLMLGVLGIVLGIAYVIKDPKGQGLDEAKELLQYIFTALLPLWGTWIGTVLAYYFSKENFEAANKQVRELVGRVTVNTEKLKSTIVSQAMMPYHKIIRIDVGENADPDSLLISDLYHFMITNNIRRALVFQNRRIVYALHKSVISDFLFQLQQSSGKSVAELQPTISMMKTTSDKDIQNAFIDGAVTIEQTATLIDVKNIFDNSVGCQDVFIT